MAMMLLAGNAPTAASVPGISPPTLPPPFRGIAGLRTRAWGPCAGSAACRSRPPRWCN